MSIHTRPSTGVTAMVRSASAATFSAATSCTKVRHPSADPSQFPVCRSMISSTRWAMSSMRPITRSSRVGKWR
ncbi:hypothetical protein BJF89_10065 [Corynebacterium sp. CNJ-954]|uniref:hypothetical protein n=1 Tax=Corynebacterium sp. CNJ-954 TaxID=1904962 RepID=UPI000959B62F|nr:hypothetical protein [Corynebacterium sp. CNJ-954]OLT50263.1 hypothetical protein BJF89_10065 [Corynebacterium sp. CNJ-954]